MYIPSHSVHLPEKEKKKGFVMNSYLHANILRTDMYLLNKNFQLFILSVLYVDFLSSVSWQVDGNTLLVNHTHEDVDRQV